MPKKKIVFLTGTRADFGKIKPLIQILQGQEAFEPYIFVTGMHMSKKYGYTAKEIDKCGFDNIFQYINHQDSSHMDQTLAKTIEGFSYYINEIKPDLIVVHGDRVEAMAGAIVGSLNNILVAHIEGGELSGTIDELIRHAVSKMSHLHLVANDEAAKRLKQLGELDESIFVIGSPDLDVMNSPDLPSIESVKTYYDIAFEAYAILMFHPVTTELSSLKEDVSALVDAVLASKQNYVVIYPNNDSGSDMILETFKRFENNERFKVFPSLRFEKFLTLMEHAQFMIGNSSAGIREAPFYGLPSVNIGNRQKNRSNAGSIVNAGNQRDEISSAIRYVLTKEHTDKYTEVQEFGNGNSADHFLTLLKEETFWNTSHQKQFQDRA